MINKILLKFKIIILLSFVFQSVSVAQNIEILEERELNLGLDNMILVENHLTSNPFDQNHLLLSGMYVDSKDTSSYGNYAIVSYDRGKSWKYLNKFDIPEGADPWGLITTKGAALSAVLGLEELFIFRSNNGGKNWNKNPINLGKNHDHETIIQDVNQNIIYVVSIKGNNIYVNYSLDDGLTFDNPSEFKFSNLGSNTMTPVLLSDGTLIISYTTFNRPAINGSRNNGKSERLRKNLSWTISYTIDSGFGTPLFISEACETGFPVLANGHNTRRFNNNLYYVCSSQTDRSIIFHYSDTEGQSWSSGIPIFPYTNVKTSKRNPFTGIPQVAVNSEGTVGIIWQDRTADREGKCQYLYFSASLDGGKTFLKPKKVSKKLSCMESEENNWAGSRYKSGGDYTGFIADEKGDFIIIWPDSRKGISKLYTAKIRIEK